MKLRKKAPDIVKFSKNTETVNKNIHTENHIPLTNRMWAKFTAFFMVIVMLIITVFSTIGITIMVQQNMYTTPKDEIIRYSYNSLVSWDVVEIIQSVRSNESAVSAYNFCNSKNISYVEITDSKSKELIWEFTNDIKQENAVIFDFADVEKCNVKIAILEEPVINDNYMFAHNIIDFFYAMLYWIYVVAVLAFLCAAASFVFLMCASGHSKRYNGVRAGWGTRIPFDLLTAVFGIFLYAVIRFLFGGNFYLTEVITIILFLVISITVISAASLGWLMSLAVRIKLGKWWKNTIIFRVFVLLRRLAKLIGRKLLRFAGLFRNIPVVWKAALTVVCVSIAELILMICAWNDYGKLMLLWLFNTIVLGTAVLYCALAFKKLQKGGEMLADGDLSCQIDTSMLCGVFKRFGKSLNSIARGMSIAVEERMKSERMKTELITNVSHDIKTPLTSIINYTDLISKESCDNQKINEYAQVLLRQSERLKRLIEDLVEASKASTGNLEVILAPCEANILLTQIVGEYEEKFHSKNLELITAQPQSPAVIMADGRRLWRVVDNLMNNIYKYAQSNTRVYLSLEKTGNEAVITFKNTSYAPLNISADELMERFVRGDASRNTEGNGLGLSIAKSLTELQKGAMEISIDGDLFKVTLRFPIIK